MFRVAHDDYFWHLWQMCGKRNESVCVCVLCLPQMLPLPSFLSLLQFIYKQSKSSPFNCFICQTKSILIAFSCWHFECHERAAKGVGRGEGRGRCYLQQSRAQTRLAQNSLGQNWSRSSREGSSQENNKNEKKTCSELVW